ncbi:MAG: phenylacetate--CoA ligase family protein [Alphaproteobacteria bacterium]|uniref:Phenylacetate--CoA ligase family protein n=1 Tax=Candidatus Nitrobium versatile TaxID=2884831 RepID=A0A953JB48_9BACT|nr:phenylacetate--CoA ligase family protein [Candidatus Nitrobium versatile]
MRPERFRGDFYSRVVRHVVAPLWAMKERSPYLKHLRYLETSQYRPLEEVRRDQWRRLRRLLHHAGKHTEFYAARMRERGIQPGDIVSWEDFTRLPLLTKDDIRANRDGMVARTVPPERLRAKKTSGSTGVSLDFVVDEDSLQWKRACALRHDRWTGWDLGEKVAAVWGNPEYKKSWRGHVRNFLLERYTYLDTLKMDEEEMLRFYHCTRRKMPTLLFGHAHSLFLFARFLEKNNLGGIRPAGVISTAMVLHDFERKLIERVFGCRVTNRYGCEEVSLIACECEEHDGLHINMDTVIVEVVRDGKPVPPGETGALVVTDLTNYGMPFIRYKVGDAGALSDRVCPCGCTYPLLESLEGRIADYIVTPEGKYISGISLTENFAMLLGGIKQLQIVQERIDFLLFRIVRGEGFNGASLGDLGALVAKRFGNGMRYGVELVDSLQQENSGKYRFCISKLKDGPF